MNDDYEYLPFHPFIFICFTHYLFQFTYFMNISNLHSFMKLKINLFKVLSEYCIKLHLFIVFHHLILLRCRTFMIVVLKLAFDRRFTKRSVASSLILFCGWCQISFTIGRKHACSKWDKFVDTFEVFQIALG